MLRTEETIGTHQLDMHLMNTERPHPLLNELMIITLKITLK